jgi:hypothetical protein
MSSSTSIYSSASEFLGEGSYGCVYNSGITCKGKKNKKKTVTKIQEINFFSNNEKQNGAYIKKNIKNYRAYFGPVIKSCIVKFSTIEKSNIDTKKCSILYNDYNPTGTPLYNEYILMYSYFIKNYTMKDFHIHYKFEFVFNALNQVFTLTYAISLLNKIGIVHNDLHMSNVLINLKNYSPFIIDFGLSFNINDCYKLNKDYIDFQYIKKFFFDFRSDSYHWNIEKRFISFIIYNRTKYFPNQVSDNNENNNISKEAIDYFIKDCCVSITMNEEMRVYITTDELIDYKKSLQQFYYQFLDTSQYPKYNSVVKYLINFVYMYNDLYSLAINLLYLSYIKVNKNKNKNKNIVKETTTLKVPEYDVKETDELKHDVKETDDPEHDVKETDDPEQVVKETHHASETIIKEDSLTSEELFILDFFSQLYKKTIYPEPTMRLTISEVLDLYTFFIHFINNYNLKTVKNTIKLDFITALVKFMKSKKISIKVVFYKRFAYLNFNSLCSESIFQAIKNSPLKL